MGLDAANFLLKETLWNGNFDKKVEVVCLITVANA